MGGQEGEGGGSSPGPPPNLPISPTSFLHPNSGKKSKYQTSVRRKTLNPEFNEVSQGGAGSSQA
jgi:hypothetical protein